MKYRPHRASLVVTVLLVTSLVFAGCENGASHSALSGGGAADAQPTTGDSAPQTGDQPGSDETPPADDDGAADVQATSSENGQPQGEVRSTAAPTGETKEITFEDLLITVQQPDIVIRPWMFKDSTTQLDGQKIRIQGYMLADAQLKGIKEFILLRNTECKFGPGGQADHLIRITMNEGQTAEFTDKPVAVEGVLTINPFQGPDGNTWSIYDMAAGKVTVERR